MTNSSAFSIILGLQEQIKELQLLVDKLKSNIVSEECVSHKCVCVIQDSKQEGKQEWTDLTRLHIEDCITTTTDQNLQSESQDESKKIADEIHNIADSLPTYGSTVDVYVWPMKDKRNSDTDGYIHYLGSLRRLVSWHSAKFTIIAGEMTEETEFLQRFLSASLCLGVDDMIVEHEVCAWRGKITVCNKIENSGMTIPGVCMYKTGNTTIGLQCPRITNTAHSKTQDKQLGRMFEVLDEVDLSSVSALMKTPYTYKISLCQKHPYSQVLLEHILENENTGLVARLPIYPCDTGPVCCGDTNLSTRVWKDNIGTDLQFVQEPEEDLQDNYEFLYFIITSPGKHSSLEEENYIAIGYQLQHPYDLNSSLLRTVYHKTLLTADEAADGGEVDLTCLPVMSCDTLRDVEADFGTLRKEMLQNWIREKQSKGKSTEVTVDELLAKIRHLQMIYLDKMSEKLLKFEMGPSKLQIDLQKSITEISESSYDWPERLIQQYEESQKRLLSRIQSSDSVAMSSPVQPCETSSTVDIQSFLNFFHPDGSASNESLSPVRRRHASRARSKRIEPDISSPNIMSWPESKDTLSHDIYYNVDRKSEKINNHLNKIQEKFVKDETYSSCLSPIVLFPKCDGGKTRKRSLPLEVRKSPRKKPSRTFYDENVSLSQSEKKTHRTKFTRLSDSLTPLASVPEKVNRRVSTSHTPHTHGQDPKDHSKRRRSEVVSSKSNMDDEQGRKESRSERHKRRLQDIVDLVLIEKGVDRSDPIFKASSARLFKVTKLFVMDLPNSRNLKDEMRKIAQSQAQHVIDVDRSRMKSK